MKTKFLSLIFFLFIVCCNSAHAQFTKIFDFDGETNGSYPKGSFISDGTFLYGMTTEGGANSLGTIFKIKTDGSSYIKLLDFAGDSNGSFPSGSLLSVGGFLYGTTSFGGINGHGTLFKIKPDGSTYTKLIDFAAWTNTSGAFPGCTLISDGTFLYGTTSQGGTNGFGTVFKIRLDGSGYVNLFEFSIGSTNGAYPHGSLISDGTFLYGMTLMGGTNNNGTLFKLKPDGSNYAKLLDFDGASNGSNPVGSLISDGTFLYGMTDEGGTNWAGTLFKIKPDGSDYIKLLDLADSTNGSNPEGSLISDGTFLYGMTSRSTYYCTTLFKIKTDGTTYTKLHDFNGLANGMYPHGSLISDGSCLYGMSGAGGANNKGAIFKYDMKVPLGIVENKPDLAISIFPNPFSVKTTLQMACIINNATLTIYNLCGQSVKQMKNIAGQKVTIYRDELPGGLYIVRLVQDNNIIATHKLVISD